MNVQIDKVYIVTLVNVGYSSDGNYVGRTDSVFTDRIEAILAANALNYETLQTFTMHDATATFPDPALPGSEEPLTNLLEEIGENEEFVQAAFVFERKLYTSHGDWDADRRT